MQIIRFTCSAISTAWRTQQWCVNMLDICNAVIIDIMAIMLMIYMIGTIENLYTLSTSMISEDLIKSFVDTDIIFGQEINTCRII